MTPATAPPMFDEELAADDLLVAFGPEVCVTKGALVFDGFRPYGQKSPPLGGRTQVSESPS